MYARLQGLAGPADKPGRRPVARSATLCPTVCWLCLGRPGAERRGLCAPTQTYRAGHQSFQQAPTSRAEDSLPGLSCHIPQRPISSSSDLGCLHQCGSPILPALDISGTCHMPQKGDHRAGAAADPCLSLPPRARLKQAQDPPRPVPPRLCSPVSLSHTRTMKLR